MSLNVEDEIELKRNLKILFVLLIFMVLCYLSAGIMTIKTEDVQRGVLPAGGGVYGPFLVTDDNSSVMIKISRSTQLKAFDWDALDIEILDENKNYLSSFGAEFWKETGLDSDGRWTASEYHGDLRYFFHKKGKYFLKVTANSNKKRNSPSLYVVSVAQQLGSAELFKKIGFWMIWISAIWFFWTIRKFEED